MNSQIQQLLQERLEKATIRNNYAADYLIYIKNIVNGNNVKENKKKLIDAEGPTMELKERIREIDRQLKQLGYTGELPGGCDECK